MIVCCFSDFWDTTGCAPLSNVHTLCITPLPVHLLVEEVPLSEVKQKLFCLTFQVIML